MRSSRLASTAIALLVTLAAGPASAATAVTSCVQHYKGNGYLTGDLDCTGFAVGAYIDGSGTLDLRGFTLTGAGTALICAGSCKLLNGTLDGNSDGVHAIKGSARVTDVVINGGGVYANKNVKLRNVTLNSGWLGFAADYGNATLVNTTVTGGVRGGKAGKSIQLIDSSVTGAYHYGLDASRVKMLRSSASGSGFDADCNKLIGFSFTLCGDILTWKLPLLSQSSCETSVVLSSNIHLPNPAGWGVCTAD